MPKEWTAEEREAAGKRLKEARARKQELKQTEQVDPFAAARASVDKWNDDRLDLLKWVARSITTINMAGKKMTNKCSLCAVSRLHREPCRHDEVWRLAGQITRA